MMLHKGFREKELRDHGVFAKGILLKAVPTRGWPELTIKYRIFGTDWQTIRRGELGKRSIGRQFFIQVLGHRPKDIFIHVNNPVPDCLLKVETPIQGWQTLPQCP